MPSRSQFSVILAVGLPLASLLLTTVACHMPSQFQPVVREFSSPNATYTVRLRGSLAAPQDPFTAHVVYAEAFKGEAQLASAYEIHYADWFDTSFGDSYLESGWVAENVLRFHVRAAGTSGDFDEVIIENRSSKTLGMVGVHAGDLFLIAELAPGKSLRLPTTIRRDAIWVAAGGAWLDGTPVNAAGKNFSPNGMPGGRHRYFVSISETGVEITGNLVGD